MSSAELNPLYAWLCALQEVVGATVCVEITPFEKQCFQFPTNRDVEKVYLLPTSCHELSTSDQL